MSCEVRFDENAACKRCGRFGAYVFETEELCADCYQTRGGCCPEFGGDDFWRPAVVAPSADEAPGGGPETP